MRFGSVGGFGDDMMLGKTLPGWWRLFFVCVNERTPEGEDIGPGKDSVGGNN